MVPRSRRKYMCLHTRESIYIVMFGTGVACIELQCARWRLPPHVCSYVCPQVALNRTRVSELARLSINTQGHKCERSRAQTRHAVRLLTQSAQFSYG